MATLFEFDEESEFKREYEGDWIELNPIQKLERFLLSQYTCEQLAEAYKNFKPKVPLSYIVADMKARRNK